MNSPKRKVSNSFALSPDGLVDLHANDFEDLSPLATTSSSEENMDTSDTQVLRQMSFENVMEKLDNSPKNSMHRDRFKKVEIPLVNNGDRSKTKNIKNMFKKIDKIGGKENKKTVDLPKVTNGSTNGVKEKNTGDINPPDESANVNMLKKNFKLERHHSSSELSPRIRREAAAPQRKSQIISPEVQLPTTSEDRRKESLSARKNLFPERNAFGWTVDANSKKNEIKQRPSPTKSWYATLPSNLDSSTIKESLKEYYQDEKGDANSSLTSKNKDDPLSKYLIENTGDESLLSESLEGDFDSSQAYEQAKRDYQIHKHSQSVSTIETIMEKYRKKTQPEEQVDRILKNLEEEKSRKEKVDQILQRRNSFRSLAMSANVNK